jgi:hypothetical protein
MARCRGVRQLAVALALLCALAVGSASAKNAPRVPGPALPKHRLTPGAHLPVGKAKVCKPGYSARVRDVPESLKDKAYARYHLKRVAYAYEVDHLVSLELGGSNALKPLARALLRPLGARTKDRLEGKLHALVCAGQLSLASAQRQEAANWIKAYKKYVGKG